MLLVVMIFCAAAAVFLIAIDVYTEFHQLWTHPDHRVVAGGSRRDDPRRKRSPSLR